MQFEEEIIPYFELAPGECSSPQHQDDVSDDSLLIFLIFIIQIFLNIMFLNMNHPQGSIGK